VWAAVKVFVPPDAYYADIIGRAVLTFIDVAALAQNPMLLLVAAVTAYLALVAALWWIAPGRSHVISVLIVVAGLAIYWWSFDGSIHAENRYTFRTAVFGATALLGLVAGLLVASAGRWSDAYPQCLAYLQALDRKHALSRTAAGALVLIALVHAVETEKFVFAWTGYKAAVRALAMGSLSDPQLGDPNFVSSARIRGDLQAVSWFSTTPYLSVLLAPRFQPRRLVVDPNGAYYWLSCETAAASHEGNGSLPKESRRLVRLYSCLHRPAKR
jgi:hypothetical protein